MLSEWCIANFDTSGVAGPLAAWCGGQICRPIVLGFGTWIACLKPCVLMPKVTCCTYSILVSSTVDFFAIINAVLQLSNYNFRQFAAP